MFGGLYALWASKMNAFGDFGPELHPSVIAGFTLDQLISPFSIWKAPEEVWKSEWNLALLILTAAQTILSTLLIALGVLAIRWRFRRG